MCGNIDADHAGVACAAPAASLHSTSNTTSHNSAKVMTSAVGLRQVRHRFARAQTFQRQSRAPLPVHRAGGFPCPERAAAHIRHSGTAALRSRSDVRSSDRGGKARIADTALPRRGHCGAPPGVISPCPEPTGPRSASEQLRWPVPAVRAGADLAGAAWSLPEAADPHSVENSPAWAASFVCPVPSPSLTGSPAATRESPASAGPAAATSSARSRKLKFRSASAGVVTGESMSLLEVRAHRLRVVAITTAAEIITPTSQSRPLQQTVELRQDAFLPAYFDQPVTQPPASSITVAIFRVSAMDAHRCFRR